MEPITDARELRVGQNYLYDGNIIKLCGSFLAMYLQNDTDLYLYPIPITEEMLLKCGFEKRQQSDNFFYFGYGTNPITKDWMLCLKYFQDENRFFFLNGHHNIKYLHQLQNLYFTLTGKELDIDLNG